jgi:hypothetical protein
VRFENRNIFFWVLRKKRSSLLPTYHTDVVVVVVVVVVINVVVNFGSRRIGSWVQQVNFALANLFAAASFTFFTFSALCRYGQFDTIFYILSVMFLMSLQQGCQMAYFHTKPPNFGVLSKALEWNILTHFMTIWYNLWIFALFYRNLGTFCSHLLYFNNFGVFYQGKSATLVFTIFALHREIFRKIFTHFPTGKLRRTLLKRFSPFFS